MLKKYLVYLVYGLLSIFLLNCNSWQTTGSKNQDHPLLVAYGDCTTGNSGSQGENAGKNILMCDKIIIEYMKERGKERQYNRCIDATNGNKPYCVSLVDGYDYSTFKDKVLEIKKLK